MRKSNYKNWQTFLSNTTRNSFFLICHIKWVFLCYFWLQGLNKKTSRLSNANFSMKKQTAKFIGGFLPVRSALSALVGQQKTMFRSLSNYLKPMIPRNITISDEPLVYPKRKSSYFFVYLSHSLLVEWGLW